MHEHVVRRTTDPALIERILREDSFDAPIPYFPPAFLRRAVRDLLASSPAVYFVVAEVNGVYAGFVLAHTLGPTIWRKFARSQLWRHPIAIMWIAIRLKTRPLLWTLRRRQRLRSVQRVRSADVANTPPAVKQLDGPFEWSPEHPDIAQVDQFFVRAPFRGLGLAARLLRCAMCEMATNNVALVEAHVDETNEPSLRAFLRAGWEAFSTRGGDFYVRCRLDRLDDLVATDSPGAKSDRLPGRSS